jgi:hypothetical protein
MNKLHEKVRKSEGKRPLSKLNAVGRIILNRVLEKYGGIWAEFVGLSAKGREFLWMTKQLLAADVGFCSMEFVVQVQ